MTCKECIHERACSTFHGGMARANLLGDKAETKCGLFKNKADFAEVRRGKWERPVLMNGHWYRRCTSCLYDSAHGDATNKEFKPAYCSNCGAKMEGQT